MDSHFAPAARVLLHLQPDDLPVLRATRDGLAGWARRIDEADAHGVGELVLRDPLMALRTLAQVAHALPAHHADSVQTVKAALLLTGIEPFFRRCAGLCVVQEQLAGRPAALAGALAALERAHASARVAAAFAVHRQDHEVELLHQAALLHDFPDLLLWCAAPAAALELQALGQSDPGLRAIDAQQAVLGTTFDLVATALLERWRLPAALCEAGRWWMADSPGARCVRLAVRLVRHLQQGVSHPAMQDDLHDAGRLLNLSPTAVFALVRKML